MHHAPGTVIAVDPCSASGVGQPDYGSRAGTLTFAAGETTQTITVPIYGDVRVEPDETFTIGLANAVGAVIADAVGAGTIENDDAAPLVDAGGNLALQLGQALGRNGSFVDPDVGELWTATVDYGDGSGVQELALGADKTFALSRTYAATGTYTVTVLVRGSGGETGTDSFTVTVAATATTTTLSSSPNPSTVGQAVTLTATVAAPPGTGTPTGNVVFRDGATPLGTVPLGADGTAVLSPRCCARRSPADGRLPRDTGLRRLRVCAADAHGHARRLRALLAHDRERQPGDDRRRRPARGRRPRRLRRGARARVLGQPGGHVSERRAAAGSLLVGALR